jgi:hypothetical protein
MPLPLPKLNDDTPLRLGKVVGNPRETVGFQLPPVIYKDRDNMTVALYWDGTRAVYPDMEKLGPRFPPKPAPEFTTTIFRDPPFKPEDTLASSKIQVGDWVMNCWKHDKTAYRVASIEKHLCVAHPRYKVPQSVDRESVKFLGRPDAEGWIPHTPGDLMPCPGDMLIVVKCRGDAAGKYHIFGETGNLCASSRYWAKGTSILAWKPKT